MICNDPKYAVIKKSFGNTDELQKINIKEYIKQLRKEGYKVYDLRYVKCEEDR